MVAYSRCYCGPGWRGNYKASEGTCPHSCTDNSAEKCGHGTIGYWRFTTYLLGDKCPQLKGKYVVYVFKYWYYDNIYNDLELLQTCLRLRLLIRYRFHPDLGVVLLKNFFLYCSYHDWIGFRSKWGSVVRKNNYWWFCLREIIFATVGSDILDSTCRAPGVRFFLHCVKRVVMGCSAGKTRQKGHTFKRLIDNKHNDHKKCITCLSQTFDSSFSTWKDGVYEIFGDVNRSQEWFRPSVICLTKCTFFGQAHQVNLCTWICTWICKVFKYYFTSSLYVEIPRLLSVPIPFKNSSAANPPCMWKFQ